MAVEPTAWIYPNPASASGHLDSMKKAFRRCVGRAGLDPRKVTPHTMRHTAITNLAETGAGMRAVQQFSGHQSIDMVMRHTHGRDERVDRAIEKMARAKTEPEPVDNAKTRNS
jgi:integrase